MVVRLVPNRYGVAVAQPQVCRQSLGFGMAGDEPAHRTVGKDGPIDRGVHAQPREAHT